MLLIGLGKGIYRNIHDSNNPASRNNLQQGDTIQYTPSPHNPQYGAPARQNTTLATREEPPPPYTREAAPEFQLPQPQAEPESQPLTRAEPQSQSRGEIPQFQSQNPYRTQCQRQPQPPARQEQILQPQTQPQSRTQSVRQPSRQEPVAQTQPPIRTQSQSQTQPTRRLPSHSEKPLPQAPTSSEYTVPPPYQQPSTRRHPSQHQSTQQQPSRQQSTRRPSEYVVVDAASVHPTQQQPSRQQSTRQPSDYVVVDAASVGVCDCVYRDGFGLAPKCRKCERQARRGTQTGERRRRRDRQEGGPIRTLIADVRR